MGRFGFLFVCLFRIFSVTKNKNFLRFFSLVSLQSHLRTEHLMEQQGNFALEKLEHFLNQ